MRTVRVTALKEFEHGGETHRRGSLVTMEAGQAAIAARRGNVSLSRAVNARSLEAEEARKADESARPKRRYRRRDMRAEE